MKKILVMVVVALSAMVSQASYLYWQVAEATAAEIVHSSDPSVGVNYATVWAVGSAGEVQLDWQDVTVGSQPAMGQMAIDLGTYGNNGYSFYIELSNYDAAKDFSTRQVLAQSETWTYDSLVSKGYVQVDHLTSIPQAWTGGAYSAPEPTSGMLLLVGLGLLALRRRV